MAAMVFEQVGTNRRTLVNFDQVTHIEAGGKTCVVHYSDGKHTVIRATFDEVCQAVGTAIQSDEMKAGA